MSHFSFCNVRSFLFCLVIGNLAFLPGAAVAHPDEETTLSVDLKKIGLLYKRRQTLDKNYVLVTLEDDRKVVARLCEDTLYLAGGFSRANGEDEFLARAAEHGAIPPETLLAMIGSREKKKEVAPDPIPLVPPFTAANFQELLQAPGLFLFPDRPREDARLIMFTWQGCPSCEKMRQYLEAYKEGIGFQVMFLPLAGNRKLDASAIAFLGMHEAGDTEKQEALALLTRASVFLGSRVGKILVPAFAWLDAQGETHIGNLDGPSFRKIAAGLNGGNPLP